MSVDGGGSRTTIPPLSPPLSEQAGEPAWRINPHELATRLSYFLWSSMPDEELFRAADSASIPERISLRTVSGVIPWTVL